MIEIEKPRIETEEMNERTEGSSSSRWSVGTASRSAIR